MSGNPERVAVPLNGPGGRIAILELKKGGRLPDGPLAAFFNTCKVLDFSWDPFNNRRLAVGKMSFSSKKFSLFRFAQWRRDYF